MDRHAQPSPVDRLSRLPPELIHHICSFLFATHRPPEILSPAYQAGCLDTGAPRNQRREREPRRSHPLDYLSATSKHLQAAINTWAHHFLLQHKRITRYVPTRPPRPGFRRNFLRHGLPGLLNWSEQCCVFCGVRTAHKAWLMSGLACCRRCDQREWPGKITLAAATEHSGLTQGDLLGPRSAHDQQPILRAGVGFFGVIYLFKTEVEALARKVHGAHITLPYQPTPPQVGINASLLSDAALEGHGLDRTMEREHSEKSSDS